MTLTNTDVSGAHLSKPLVFFWHQHQESARNKLMIVTYTGSHHPKHAKPSCSPIWIARKLAEEGTWILTQVVATCYRYTV